MHTDKRIDAALVVGVRDTPVRITREACKPEPRPSKKRTKAYWPTRTSGHVRPRGTLVRTQSWALALTYLEGA